MSAPPLFYLPLTMERRGARVVLLDRSRRPVLEVLPYCAQPMAPDFRTPEAVGAIVGSQLNWHPAMVEFLKMVARVYLNSPETATPVDKFHADRALEILRGLAEPDDDRMQRAATLFPGEFVSPRRGGILPCEIVNTTGGA